MLERHELEAFLTLAEELHFGRTAERLHVSTARISQTIRRLERRIGVPLFERTSRRVALTATGAELYAELRPAWTRIGAAVERATRYGRGMAGTLRVGFTGAAAGQLMLDAAGPFRDRHPGSRVLLEEVRIRDWPLLRDGELDLLMAAGPLDVPGVAAGPVLVREAAMLAVPAGHPFARRASVSLEDLARVPVLRHDGELPASYAARHSPTETPAGRPVPSGPRASTLNEFLAFVSAGEGVLPVGAQARRYYPRPGVAYVPFSDAPPVEWSLFWREDRATALVLAFAAAAAELLGRDP
ncbi:LysR family transcriptional regulator [Actinomadura macrotermitis]|uniref:HTH-type transcriptional regulator GltC n=1 Tax=Actinomadura macrotermitis TaxID=2585200 RepID=A0A7K0BXA5_9ACTN|nr:LysR family transcriptional regulator [Actinomadura macrotermitis]MQY05815.1 HTH-type transcriptional regulator GltC [Actinomadura macrotermitis]